MQLPFGINKGLREAAVLDVRSTGPGVATLHGMFGSA